MQTYRDDLLEHANQMLALLGDALDVDMTLDESGGCFFEHDDGWRMGVMLTGQDQIVAAVTVLPNVTPPTDEKLVSILTEFNWLGGHTGGAAFSWNPASNSFVLWRSQDAETSTAENLNRNLIKLVETAAAIQPALRGQLEGVETTAKEDAPHIIQPV